MADDTVDVRIHLFKATLGRSALSYQCSGRVVARGLMHCKPPDGHDRVVQIVEFLHCSNMQRLTYRGRQFRPRP